MMKHQKYQFEFEVHDSSDSLTQEDRDLLEKAKQATHLAYAPYSDFHVGAVAKLTNGETVVGSNQENASFPVGLCAERVLLSSASSLFPNTGIATIAISYDNRKGPSSHPVSPCGVCRQSLLEHEERYGHPVRLILGGMEGKIYVISRASVLLPLSFTASDMG